MSSDAPLRQQGMSAFARGTARSMPIACRRFHRPADVRRLALAVGAALAGLAPLCAAQVVLDGTLGRGGALTGPNYTVAADRGRQLGGNLFHSFSTFSIAQGESAVFTGPTSVHNILARVTGGTASTIDGRLRSEIPSANLYLLNPAGVIFGPHAALEVSGSFHVSTADYLRLGTDGRFAATNPASSVLSMAPPAAFGFLSAAPGRIELNGTRLTGTPSAALSLIGGDIVARTPPGGADGPRLTVQGGTVALASVASAGEIAPEHLGPDAAGLPALGAIDLQPGTVLDVAAAGDAGRIIIRGGRVDVTGAELAAWSYGSGRGGEIDIGARGGLNIDGGSASGAAGAGRLLTVTQGPLDGGGITLSADTLHIGGNASVQSITAGPGRGGDIRLRAREIALHGGALVNSDTRAGGRAGDIEIEATVALALATGSRVQNVSLGSGAGGRIDLRAGRIGLSGASGVRSQALASGDAGGLTAAADTIDLDGGSHVVSRTQQGAGAGGSITLEARTVSLGGGSWVGADAAGAGRGGDLTIAAHERLTLDASHVSATRHASGEGGAIAIRAGAVVLERGAQVSGVALPGSTARGADIDITADSVRLTGGSSVSSASDALSGAGLIAVQAAEIVVASGSAAQVRSGGEGPGGAILIAAARLTLEDGGWVGSETGRTGTAAVVHSARGAGGALRVQASEWVVVRGPGSGIASITHGEGSGGPVHVETPRLSLAESGAIASHAGGSGDAGTIVLEIGRLELNGGVVQHSLAGGPPAHAPAVHAIAIRAADVVILTGNARITSHTSAAAHGGRIALTADTLELRDDARISTHASGSGDAGSIGLAGRVVAAGGGTGMPAITSRAAAGGRTGRIEIAASESITLDRAMVQTAASGSGDGGDVTIAAPLVALSGGAAVEALTVAEGRAGSIVVEGTRVDLSAGARIASASGALDAPGGSLLAGGGAAGDVVVSATDAVTLAGTSGANPGGLYSQTLGTGAGGHVTVATPHLELSDGARISARTARPQAGGGTRIEARTIVLTGASAITGTGSLALVIDDDALGTITIDATHDAILASTPGAGTQGTAVPQAATLTLHGGSVSIDGAPPEPAGFIVGPDRIVTLGVGGAIIIVHGTSAPPTAAADGNTALLASPGPGALPGAGVHLAAPAPAAPGIITLALGALVPGSLAPSPHSGGEPTGGPDDLLSGSILPETREPEHPRWAPWRNAPGSSDGEGQFAGSAPLLTDACAPRGSRGNPGSLVVSGQGGLPRAPGGGLLATFLDLDRGELAAAAQPASRAMLALRCGRS